MTKKFILFLLKTGERVRIPLNKKTYINPETGRRLKTSALINQHKQFQKHQRYTNKLISNDPTNEYGLKGKLVKHKFGTDYLATFGGFKSIEPRVKEQLYLRYEQKAIVDIQSELNIRRELDDDRAQYVEGEGWIRSEKEILQDYQRHIQPRNRRLYANQTNAVFSRLRK